MCKHTYIYICDVVSCTTSLLTAVSLFSSLAVLFSHLFVIFSCCFWNNDVCDAYSKSSSTLHHKSIFIYVKHDSIIYCTALFHSSVFPLYTKLIYYFLFVRGRSSRSRPYPTIRIRRIDPEYEDFRAEATQQKARQLECFSKAAEAYKQGRKEVASFYAQQVRSLNVFVFISPVSPCFSVFLQYVWALGRASILYELETLSPRIFFFF